MSSEPCPLCGSVEHQALFVERGHTLVACAGCELLFITPYPRQAEEVYSVVKDYHYDELEILNVARHYATAQRFYTEYYPRVRPDLIQASSMLDIGCGTGRLLELAGEFPQLRRVGLELNADRAPHARRVAKCEVVEMPLEKYRPEQPFDAITMINVFSHVPNINEVFTALRQLLSPQGKLILGVGEFSPKVRKDAIYDWQIPDHLQFLGMGTTEFLARKHGMKIVRRERIPLAYEMFSRGLLSAPGRSGFRNAIKKSILYTPGAVALMRSLYRWRHHDSVYSSVIVLQRDDAPSTGK